MLRSTKGGSSNRAANSGRIGMQSCPRPWVIMKLTNSGVIFSAPQIKSPSFSRSSASITMTTLPAAMASTAASIVENCCDMKKLFLRKPVAGVPAL